MGSPKPEREVLFWKFIVERQMLFERRRMGYAPPWTADPVIANHRFTNVYRAADRVSQYLINDVLYHPNASTDVDENVFRALLFRIFNLPITYRALHAALGEHPSLSNWSPVRYSRILDEWIDKGGAIWGNAYMIPPPQESYGGRMTKHRAWLNLLGTMIDQDVPDRIVAAKSLGSIYHLLHEFPTMGQFLAFQFTIDINYSAAVDFDENSFVVPGPGAVRGATKLGWPGRSAEAAISHLTASQEVALYDLELGFPWLGGSRRLHLIDVQNCLCEFDKYTRVTHPEWAGGGRTQIKQRFYPESSHRHNGLLVYNYPPKWHLGGSVEQ